MTKQTKHDLSYNKVTLDYQALVATATYAVVGLRDRLNDLLHKTYGIDAVDNLTATDASFIVDTATKLGQAIESYHALTAGLDRDEKVIINAS